MSDDGTRALSVIAFIGSVFSPYYAVARRAGPADPRGHCALNVALYGVRGPGWAMTERNKDAVHQSADTLRIGASALEWRDGALHITIEERAAPLPRRLRGSIILHPAARFDDTIALDAAGRHRWTPLAPCARAEVRFTAPAWTWSGHAYLDSNDGDAALEDDFCRWDWSRAATPDGGTTILYDAMRRDGSRLAFARSFFPDGTQAERPMPPRQALPPGLWRVPRLTHGDAPPRLLRPLEDGPFYTRSLISMTLGGNTVPAMHESLSLDRFRQRWVQTLLPFRMPR